MFRLYHKISGNKEVEVLPINNYYTVNELGKYRFEYIKNDSIESDIIYLEDEVVDDALLDITGNSIKSEISQFFQDYFGFAKFEVDKQVYLINIQIEKLKLPEIEGILMFLWEAENKVFNVFLSKSTIKSSASIKGEKLGVTSKYITFCNYFHDEFEKLFFHFNTNPHLLLRSKAIKSEYNPNQVSSKSVEFILNNLDELDFNPRYRQHPESLVIGNRFCLPKRIEVDIKYNSFDTYENSLILGGFTSLIRKLKKLKKTISKSVSTSNINSNNKYVDFRDLKKMPLAKLFRDAKDIETKLNRLYFRYKKLFVATQPRDEQPIRTPAFNHNIHYRQAFKILQKARNVKFVLDGEFEFLKLRRLSQLYEIYNFHQIIIAIEEKINLPLFTKNSTFEGKDKISGDEVQFILSEVQFIFKDIEINVYYELTYYGKINPKSKGKLIRLDNEEQYYRPDFIIEIRNKEEYSYYVLDAKYSRQVTVKNQSLRKCAYKYIVNTGIYGEPYKKVEKLCLLYPGEDITRNINHSTCRPSVEMVGSKPNQEQNLRQIISEIIEEKLPTTLFYKSIK